MSEREKARMRNVGIVHYAAG